MPWQTSQHPSSTRQSRRERQQVLAAWPVCYLGYPDCTIDSTEDDHVIPLAEGGTHALHNRRGACHNCHTIKTRAEAQRGKKRRQQSEPHPGLIDRGMDPPPATPATDTV